MAECYPTGCPPCTEEIKFPEKPTNGQRQCFSIGKDPNTGEDLFKCWVYDQCIPGWRAEGPSGSPINFKGGVDLTKTQAANNITTKEAGDYYVVTVASATQGFLDLNWSALKHPVEVGAYIMWAGDQWVEIPQPCGDQGGGGSGVQSDWLETDTNSAAFIKNKPELPDGVGNIEGGSIVITVNSTAPEFCPFSTLTLEATVNPTSADGKPVVGFFEYTWESSTNAGNWTPFGQLVRTTETSYSTTSEKVIENYNATPDRFRLKVKFTDFYGNVIETTSAVITPVAKDAYFISTHPGSLDLSGSTTNGTFTVSGSGADVTEYRWYVNRVPITGPNNIPGYTMSGWTGSSLGVTRTAADAGSTYAYVDIYADSDCTPVITSNQGALIGPEPTPPDNGADGGDGGDGSSGSPGGPGGAVGFGDIGYRCAFRSGYQKGIYWNSAGSGPNTYGPSLNEVLYLISATIQEGFPAIAYGTLDGNGAPLDGEGPPANLPIAALKGKWKVETMLTDSFGQRTGTLIRIE